MQTWLRSNWLRVIVHVGALLPLIALIYDNYTYNLTANPIQNVTIRTGKAALVLLVLSLACTPLNSVFGFKQALKVRRALGLYGFMYVGLHLATFVVLDYGVDLQLIAQAVIEKYFVIAGFVAFLILVPLAITSTRGWQKRLGKNWKTLHKLVYLAVPIAVLHFALLVKSVIGRPEPLLWGALVLGLLALRLPAVRKWFADLRGRRRANGASKPVPAGAPAQK
jgi:sulfoxide reductase heme-binding subunit YedZ